MLPEIISGGSSILGTAIGAISGAVQNKRQREYETGVYNKQRQDALSDWQRQNEYNHPSSQMARLREAGLNPNLVYGSGSAQSPAGMVRSTEQKVSPRQPLGLERLGDVGQNLVQTHFNTKLQQLQADQVRAQNTILVNKAAMQGLEAAQISSRTSLNKFQIENSKRLADASIRKIEANILESEANTRYKTDENTRRTILTSQSVKESGERILRSESERALNPTKKAHLEAQIKDIESNVELKKFEAELNKLGMTKGDELWQRLLAKGWGDVTGGMTITEAFSKLWQAIKSGLMPW